MAGHLDGHVGGSAKAIEPQPLARLHLAQPQCPVADDARAKERRGLCIVKALRDGVGVILGHDHGFGVAAVGVQAGELGIRAQVL
jgi:hypothetical protein